MGRAEIFSSVIPAQRQWDYVIDGECPAVGVLQCEVDGSTAYSAFSMPSIKDFFSIPRIFGGIPLFAVVAVSASGALLQLFETIPLNENPTIGAVKVH